MFQEPYNQAAGILMGSNNSSFNFGMVSAWSDMWVKTRWQRILISPPTCMLHMHAYCLSSLLFCSANRRTTRLRPALIPYHPTRSLGLVAIKAWHKLRYPKLQYIYEKTHKSTRGTQINPVMPIWGWVGVGGWKVRTYNNTTTTTTPNGVPPRWVWWG